MKVILILITFLYGCASAPQKVLDLSDYRIAISRHVWKEWGLWNKQYRRLDCVVLVSQNRVGEIVSAEIAECNGDENEKNTILDAVISASPLPLPDDMALFEPDLVLRFCPFCRIV
ncbi:MAG: TonB C-terminal domain-containing protein [Gammaproteobacteria bacterium]|nr:TonB C-terminal domain-containing protein [Gammaproteobacteria bacterium]